MAWYFVEAGTQKGPFDDNTFLELVTSGAIKADTLVWREGMKDWTPYATAAGSSSPGAAAGSPTATATIAGAVFCGECGRSVPAGETVMINGRPICATCKPAVVQRMIEGTSSGAGGLDPEELLADLRSRGGYDIDIGSVVSRSFDLVKEHLWPSIGVALLMGIIAGAGGVIPIIGVFVSWLLQGMVTGGTYRYFLLKVRGQGSTLNDAFVGFQAPRMKELMLAGMVVNFPAMLMGLFGVGVQLVSMVQSMQTGAEDINRTLLVFGLAMGGLWLVALLFALVWTPALVIIGDVPLGFWKALELSRRLVMQRFFTWVGVYLVMMLLSLAGILALCVGIFFVMPMFYVMFAMIWNDICRQAAEVKQARVGQAV